MRINWNPGRDELRKFGLTMLAGSAAAAALLYWRGSHGAAMAVIAAGAAICLAAIAGGRPALAIYRAWMGIAYLTGGVMSRVVLAAAYYLVVTPTGLLMRLAGIDRLGLKTGNADSYWVDLREKTSDHSHERQF